MLKRIYVALISVVALFSLQSCEEFLRVDSLYRYEIIELYCDSYYERDLVELYITGKGVPLGETYLVDVGSQRENDQIMAEEFYRLTSRFRASEIDVLLGYRDVAFTLAVVSLDTNEVIASYEYSSYW